MKNNFGFREIARLINYLYAMMYSEDVRKQLNTNKPAK